MNKIMFNDKFCLTQAVLDGRKTMTRRIISEMVRQIPFSSTGWEYIHSGKEFKPKYKIGEIVAVAQSIHDVCKESDHEFKTLGHLSHCFGAAWNNKMFVESSRMPHQIKITNICIEWLQDISDEDCINEGVELNTLQYECDGSLMYCVRGLGHWRGFGCYNFDSPKKAFAALIDKINGKGTWDSNPQVCVYEFELIK